LPFWPLLQYAVVLRLLLLVRSFLWTCGMCNIVSSYLLPYHYRSILARLPNQTFFAFPIPAAKPLPRILAVGNA
jgi:hypothetical protein